MAPSADYHCDVTAGVTSMEEYKERDVVLSDYNDDYDDYDDYHKYYEYDDYH